MLQTIIEFLIENGIIGWLVGLAGIALLTGMWKVIKEMYQTQRLYQDFAEDGKWTDKEKTRYIERSGQMWEQVNSFLKLLWKSIKKLFGGKAVK